MDRSGDASERNGSQELRETSVLLPFQPPYDWEAMLSFLAARAVAGVEEVSQDMYRRRLDAEGTVEVAHDAAGGALAVVCRLPVDVEISAILARVRRLFDVDADVATIGRSLARDPFLAPLVERRPGLRTPGAWDGFELAVRAILGQQVTLAAARLLAGRLVALCAAVARPGALSSFGAFPSAAQVLACDLGGLGMPAARRAALVALAEASRDDARLFTRSEPLDDEVTRLRSVRGIGEWTAQYIALRALRASDAFPASDVGLLRAAAAESGGRPTPAELLARSEAWRPWRAYAAQHLWTELASPRPNVATGSPSI